MVNTGGADVSQPDEDSEVALWVATAERSGMDLQWTDAGELGRISVDAHGAQMRQQQAWSRSDAEPLADVLADIEQAKTNAYDRDLHRRIHAAMLRASGLVAPSTAVRTAKID